MDPLGQVGNSKQWDKRKTFLCGTTNEVFICQNTMQTCYFIAEQNFP